MADSTLEHHPKSEAERMDYESENGTRWRRLPFRQHRRPRDCAAALLLALLSLTSLPAKANANENVLYSFQGGNDGREPFGSLIADKHGNLFGVTNVGGTGSCTSYLGDGCGTVFELSPQGRGSWAETVLYSFQGKNDGQYPQAALVSDGRGNLYGTTTQGGTGSCSNMELSGCGTVFELSPQGDGSWNETVLYSFQGEPDGNGDGDAASPNSLEFDGSGNLFGFATDGGACSTEGGSTSCDGAAFELYRHAGAWREKIIYRADASTEVPSGATFDEEGNLYASSAYAGPENVGDVFRLTPPPGKGSWTAQILYTFQNQTDGAFPSPGFVFDDHGNLYGASAGTDSVASNVFELTPSNNGTWTESVVYSFVDEGIDVYPSQGPIMDTRGNLFGATNLGGAKGDGTVYKVTRKNGAWTGKILHDFAGGGDGSEPLGGLVTGKAGALYGTTALGGTGGCNGGCGTVFRMTP